MLIGTNHCFQLENFGVKGNVSAYLFNGFGLTEADRQLAPRIGTDNGLSLAPEISLIDHRLPTYDLYVHLTLNLSSIT